MSPLKSCCHLHLVILQCSHLYPYLVKLKLTENLGPVLKVSGLRQEHMRLLPYLPYSEWKVLNIFLLNYSPFIFLFRFGHNNLLTLPCIKLKLLLFYDFYRLLRFFEPHLNKQDLLPTKPCSLLLKVPEPLTLGLNLFEGVPYFPNRLFHLVYPYFKPNTKLGLYHLFLSLNMSFVGLTYYSWGLSKLCGPSVVVWDLDSSFLHRLIHILRQRALDSLSLYLIHFTLYLSTYCLYIRFPSTRTSVFLCRVSI